jgi:2-methylisocitrate lyase-like PEP mutase family enzyme
MSRAAVLKERLARKPALLTPGCYDALSALLIERSGFEAAYVSGAAIAYTQLGRPDIGLVSSSEVAAQLGRMADRVTIPLIVDADTGWGNALNVQRIVREFERNGAAALQLEDQSFPKRCGHLSGKDLISKSEMIGKVKAAVDARDAALIIARTDAIAVEGFDAALERAHAYVDAGADMIFVEAPQTLDQLRAIVESLGPRVALLANMVEGGKTPILTRDELSAMGFALVLSPGGLVRAQTMLAEEYLASLRQHGTTAPFKSRMHDFAGINAVVGLGEINQAGERYKG